MKYLKKFDSFDINNLIGVTKSIFGGDDVDVTQNDTQNDTQNEYDIFVQDNGGLDNIITTVLDSCNPDKFMCGDLRVNNEEIYICTDTSKHNRITSIHINVVTGKISMEYSYAAYNDNETYVSRLTKNQIRNIKTLIETHKDRKKYNL